MNTKKLLSVEIAKLLHSLEDHSDVFKYNQKYSLMYLSDILKKERRGAIIADEVGLGKTRIAIYTMLANILIGESSIVLVPPGLMHQWVQEWKEVLDQLKLFDLLKDRIDLIEEPIKIQRLSDIYGITNSYPICTTEKPRIIIIPHTLNLLIKPNCDFDYIDLPQLIKAHDKKLPNSYAEKVYFNAHHANIESRYYSKGKASMFLYKKRGIYSKEERKLIEEREFHFKARPRSRNKYNKLANQFTKDGPGVSFLFKSFFKLIGSCSLLIIDEAQKTKSETGHDGVLGRVIKFIKISSPYIFTIGMTATPIELSPREWSGILRRVGEDIENTEIIDNFHSSLKEIRLNPSNLIFQKQILEKSRAFERFIKKNVSRRVRAKQNDYKNLIINTQFNKESAFPHHNRKVVSIKLEELKEYGDKWLDLTFSFESLTKCIRGNKNFSLRRATLFDKAFVRGDLNSKSLNDIKSDFELTVKTNHDKRVLFWINRLIDNIKLVEAENKIHPRIDKTIKLVEEILFNDDGTFKNEKVLIFGTFTESTRILNEKINARFSLRLVDQGFLFPIGEKYLKHLAKEYKSIDKSIFHKNLSHLESPILAILENYRAEYIKFRNKLNDKISVDLFRNKSFIGDAFFENNRDRCQKAKEFFSYIVINRFLSSVKVDLNSPKDIYSTITKDEVENIINQEWEKIVSDYCDNKEVRFDDYSSGVQGDTYQSRRLDAYIDGISDVTFSNILSFALGENIEGGYKNYTSQISRRIYGSTPMNTRKNVQNQFNDISIFPKILVAQSRVGREGLNLHKACRNLILFHQEWNPGVVEQQIGRIDRIESYWELLLKKWEVDNQENKENIKNENAPQINIYSIVFEGTYDEHQSHILNERAKNLRAHLYGGILTEECLDSVEDEFKIKVKKAAPDFSPRKYFS